MSVRARVPWLPAATAAVFALVGGLVVAGAASPPPAAADGRRFTPGMIIADEVFFAPQAMTAAEVEAFLEEKGASCVPGPGGVPCLKDYRESTPSRAATAQCAAYAGAANESAARIIWKSAQACGINPQAILVTLQKEQGLVTASAGRLTATRFTAAMGFRCPTNLPCEPQYAGFANQVYSAAARFQYYADHPTSFTYRPNQRIVVPYHPDAACGGAEVHIRNQATAGLYNYTPFQPNSAALAAGYGVGDRCSAYGNRNFWNYFNDWFGPTIGEAYNPFGNLEVVAGRPGGVAVRGWAIDPDTTAAVYLWVTLDGAGRYLRADAPRPDVGQAYPAAGGAHGFATVLPAAPGIHRLCVTASNVDIGKHTSLGCRTAVVPGGSPAGNLERAAGVSGGVALKGWAIDPDTTSAVYLWVTVDGAGRHLVARAGRPDVGAAYPLYGPDHGVDEVVPVAAGTHRVCVSASNVGVGSHTSLGCRTVAVPSGSPVGRLEAALGAPGEVQLRGWAIDPDTTAPVYLWLTLDGAGRHVRADVPRPDVAAAYPGSGPAHGFRAALPAERGTHTVCATASNVGPGGHTPLGCRTVGVP
jgi:hypothetical protein